MVKLSALDSSSWRRSKNAVLRVKVLEQIQEQQLRRLTTTLDKRVKTIDSKSETIRAEMSVLGTGMTHLDSYFDRDNVDEKHNATSVDQESTDETNEKTAFPPVRNSKGYEPRPCWFREHGSPEKCRLFPCRPFTSYHFLFRDLPTYVEETEMGVQKGRNKTQTLSHGEFDRSCREQEEKLPPIQFSGNMTIKEWKLKMLIESKRLQNKADNKPKDRTVNYGTHMPVRLLRKPVRSVVRKIHAPCTSLQF